MCLLSTDDEGTGSMSELPTYESNATPEQKAQKLNFMHKQLKFIKFQEADNIPLARSQIRCGCYKLVKFIYAYRCLYCGVWYCKQCAEEHFGMKVKSSE